MHINRSFSDVEKGHESIKALSAVESAKITSTLLYPGICKESSAQTGPKPRLPRFTSQDADPS